MSRLVAVMTEVAAERLRQDEKWGEQNHLNGTGPQIAWLLGLTTAGTSAAMDIADAARRQTERKTKADRLTWRHVLVEEIAEAFAEDDPAKLREELIQSAAVIVAWAEAIDRRAAADA